MPIYKQSTFVSPLDPEIIRMLNISTANKGCPRNIFKRSTSKLIAVRNLNSVCFVRRNAANSAFKNLGALAQCCLMSTHFHCIFLK